MLIDISRCVGCGSCVDTCMTTYGIPEPKADHGRPADENDLRFVRLRTVSQNGEDISIRQQCMHCREPACAAACLTKAMYKTPEGPVIWRASKCMGCRYCMLSCPFEVPKFEYFSANPRILKCRMCWERLTDGKTPVCVEACPQEAVMFGERDALVAEARKRIHDTPGKYVEHIYGEHEVGGTNVLYLSSVPFEKLGFRTDLGTVSYPEYCREFLYAVPFILGIFPPLLLGISRATAENAAEPTHESVEQQ
ncbi:MAG: hypothetical protein A3K18_17655 [Lentisphaerae bacterium RIFOXYA12_64_32]|nr:MAG: hypothetical protein A3K18_17655 [Lentisphaerae bacterium RIFOXYA12_64_32]